MTNQDPIAPKKINPEIDGRLEFAIAEAPSPSNGWKRLVIRSRRKTHSVVTIRWTVMAQ